MDSLAAKPDTWLDLDDLATATSLICGEVKGRGGPFTNHIRKTYAATGWPLESEWGPLLDNSYAAVQMYRLDMENAAAWQSVRN